MLQEYTYNALGVPQLSYTYVPVTDYATTISAVPVDRLPYPGDSIPAISPGPMISGPAAPASPGALPPGLPSALTALPAQPPNAVDVPASGNPQSAEAPGQVFDPLRAVSTVGLSEIIPEESEDADEKEQKTVLKFPGGRGVGQEADFGRREHQPRNLTYGIH